jgi:hypothetical protein
VLGVGALSRKTGSPGWSGFYLAAVLWGAVTAEGVRLAVAIADKVWPAGG